VDWIIDSTTVPAVLGVTSIRVELAEAAQIEDERCRNKGKIKKMSEGRKRIRNRAQGWRKTYKSTERQREKSSCSSFLSGHGWGSEAAVLQALLRNVGWEKSKGARAPAMRKNMREGMGLKSDGATGSSKERTQTSEAKTGLLLRLRDRKDASEGGPEPLTKTGGGREGRVLERK